MAPQEPVIPTTPEQDTPQIFTSPEEIEGFHIIRAVLRDIVITQRITMRDSLSYCAILFDDNNRKPICRLRFNNTEKLVLGLFNGKDEEKIPLSNLDEIYNYAERLKATVLPYTRQNETQKVE